jgi:hypothetical protein
MGVVNKMPNIKKMFDEIYRRLNALERTRQISFPVESDWTRFPKTPQPGSGFIDASTGLLYIYIQDVNTATTAAATFTTNPLTLTVEATGSLQANQTVAIDGGTGNKYIATVTSVTAPNTVQVTFIAVTPATAVPTGFTATVPTNPTVFPAGTKLVARSWRQIITSTDLLNKQGAIAGSTLSTTSFGGTNSAAGAHTGGTGEIVAYNGYPPYTSA